MELNSSQNFPLIVIAIFILWDFAKHQLFKKDDDLKNNTEAVIGLTVEVKNIKDDLKELALVPKDLNSLHTKIRVIESKLEN